MTYCTTGWVMTNYVATNYRTHTLGEIQDNGADLIGKEVTGSRFYGSKSRKRCYLFCRFKRRYRKTQIFLKSDNIGAEDLDMVQRMTRESTLQFTGTVSQKRPPKLKEGETPPPPAYRLLQVR